MKPKGKLWQAGEIYWAEWQNLDVCNNLPDHNNPEKIVIIKDALENLSDEAKVIAVVLCNLPDEMFTSTGRIIRHHLITHMRMKFGWTAEKTTIVQAEIAQLAEILH